MNPTLSMTVVSLLLGTSAPAHALSPVQQALDFQFYRNNVEPIFLLPRGGYEPGRSPCVTCHVHNGTPLKFNELPLVIAPPPTNSCGVLPVV